jgi:hypothetical protein
MIMKIKRRLMLCVVVLSFVFPAGASSMMAVETSSSEGAAASKSIETKSLQNNKSGIFLLAWEDNVLRTTSGALSTLGVIINDHAKVDRKKLPMMKNPPRVEFVIEENRVIQVDIYPAR